MTDEEAVERAIALIDEGMSVAGAILAVIELDEARPSDFTRPYDDVA